MNRTPWLLPYAGGLALLVALAAWRSRWRTTALWLALGLLGYAASLRLVDAGPSVSYQHYRQPAEWPLASMPAALVLAAQAIAVLIGLHRERSAIRRWLARGWRPAGVAMAALGFVLTSATLSSQPPVYGVELIVASAIQLLHLATALLAAAALPDDLAERLGHAADLALGPAPPPDEARRPRLDRLAWGLALFGGVVPAALAVFVYQLHPHVPDELVYLMHARYFAAGKLWLPMPEPAAGFEVDLMFADGGRWYSPVPPGWPAILAVGVRLGIPYLVNPLLNGANVLLTYLLLQDLFDRRTARVGAALFALSPWNLFLGMSLLTHSSALTAALAAGYGVSRWKRGGSAGGIVVGGIAIGVVSLIRPLEGLIVAGLLGFWALATRPWTRGLRGATALALVTAAAGAVVLPYNAALTGSPGRFPIMAYTDALYGPRTNALGFGPERGLGWSGLDPFPGHGPLDVLVNANLNLTTLNTELLGWATGSLLLILIGLGGLRPAAGDRRMLVAIVAVIGVHALYWFSGGPDFGPRYWYLIVVPCVALAARGALSLPGLLEAEAAWRGRSALAWVALAAGSLLVFFPWRAGDKYYHYRGMRPEARRMAADPDLAGGLVLIAGRRHPDYASAAAYNPLDLSGPGTVFGWDRSPEVRQELLRRYADRPVWLVDGPSLTGGSFRVRRGPVSATELLGR
jgi:hypothetical protein